MGCAMPQEEQKISDNCAQQQQQHQEQQHHQRQSVMAAAAVAQKDNLDLQKTDASVGGKLKGTHSALVKLLESAPIAQARPVLKQKLNAFNGNRTDQNHYRKGELGTSKCPWKKSRICTEWLLKNQSQQETPDPLQAAAATTVSQKTPVPTTHHETEFLSPKVQRSEDVEMTDLEGLVCTCHELQGGLAEEEDNDASLIRRNSSDSTDDDDLGKCDCGHCAGKQVLETGGSPALPLRASSISDSGCEDSDCAENRITDLCNRFNENLSKDDVRYYLKIYLSLSLCFVF